MRELNGKNLLNSFQEGGTRIINKRKELNSINVFPVADADTGNNLSSLMRSINDISYINDDITVSKVLSMVAEKALEYGKGNSGMIFAQYLNGVSRLFIENENTEKSFINALTFAVEDAYKAVQDPQDGTILTVIKDWANKLQASIESHSFSEALLIAKEEAKVSVSKTKYQHKTMRKNEVVDAGAKGFLLFIEGITDVFSDISTKESKSTIEIENEVYITHNHMITEVPNFRYCMEIIFYSDQNKLNKKDFEDYGDSIVLVEGHIKSKLHIHTNHPKIVVNNMSNNFVISNIKVDDMEQQYFDRNLNDKSIAIVTDSIADISKEDLKKYNIHVLSLTIMINEMEHLDKITIENNALYKLIDSDKHSISTSLPSQTNILRLFESLEQNYKEVLFISVSSELSGTYNAIQNAKKGYKGALVIEVIDSKLNSIAQGLLVKYAGEYVEKGITFEDLINNINQDKKNIDIFVSVTDLGPMIKSGRIPQILGKFFKKFKFIPIVSLDKEGKGKLSNVGFTLKSIQNKIFRKVRNKLQYTQEVSIGYTSGLENAIEWQNTLRKKHNIEAEIIKTSSIIALSAGRQSTAIAVKYRKGK